MKLNKALKNIDVVSKVTYQTIHGKQDNVTPEKIVGNIVRKK